MIDSCTHRKCETTLFQFTRRRREHPSRHDCRLPTARCLSTMNELPRSQSLMDYPALRRERLAQALSEQGLGYFLVSNPTNVTYLTGFSGESSYLLLAKNRTVLISDFRFIEQLAEECPGLETHIRPAT